VQQVGLRDRDLFGDPGEDTEVAISELRRRASVIVLSATGAEQQGELRTVWCSSILFA